MLPELCRSAAFAVKDLLRTQPGRRLGFGTENSNE
jgi:hypothetical protein